MSFAVSVTYCKSLAFSYCLIFSVSLLPLEMDSAVEELIEVVMDDISL